MRIAKEHRRQDFCEKVTLHKTREKECTEDVFLYILAWIYCWVERNGGRENKSAKFGSD